MFVQSVQRAVLDEDELRQCVVLDIKLILRDRLDLAAMLLRIGVEGVQGSDGTAVWVCAAVVDLPGDSGGVQRLTDGGSGKRMRRIEDISGRGRCIRVEPSGNAARAEWR